jgi:RND family efflux transporter MFP subunit
LAETLSTAEGDVAAAKVQVEAATVTLGRTELLLREKAASQKAVEDAKTQLSLARSTLQTAQAKAKLLASALKDTEAGAITALPMPSPLAGMVRNIHALPGQTVAAGAALFEVEKLDVLWIRVPVYAGDLSAISVDREARIGSLSGGPGATNRIAKPVPVVFSGNSNAITVDLFYELPNTQEPRLRPGQKVSVNLNVQGEADSLLVPWSAVLHDIHGGAWVYERTAPHGYTRRRVEVSDIWEGKAILARGPKEGAEIVIEGAAELFGTEFGYGK